MAVSIDLTKAFDTVSHTLLISSLSQTTLRHNTIRWLSAYLRGRMASCRYSHTTSPYRHAHAGVPQGSCISPILFNFYVSNHPDSPNLATTSYADDFTASSSSPLIPTAAAALSAHATQVSEWAAGRGLSISAPKSTVTLFTPDTHQSHTHPPVTLNDTPLPLERNPRILGVIFDPHFTFTPHITSLIKRATPRLNIIRALAGTNWGQQKETLLITFKSLIQSLFTYACPIWFPNSKPTSLQRLQTLQNAALRTATGCVRMTNIDHLHAEASVLPVANHLSLLSSQFLARCLVPSHPSHSIVTAPSGPRQMKYTLQSRFLSSVSPFLSNGSLPSDTYKPTIQSLHTSAVSQYLSSRSHNRVLSAPHPPISDEEKSLPRAYRTTLAQLRSGFAPALNSYLERVGRSSDGLCPSCRGAPHTTAHLFNCPSHPTSLSIRDLWDRPSAVVEQLGSLPLLVNLPPLPRPPPEPPPARQ